MAGGASALGAQIILNYFLRGVAPSIPGTVYMRLLKTPSTKTSSGNETAYGSYARLAMVRGVLLFTNPLLTSQSTNISPIIFPTPSSLDDDLVAWDWVNTSSGAFTETYLYGVIRPTRSLVLNKDVKFPSGALLVTA